MPNIEIATVWSYVIPSHLKRTLNAGRLPMIFAPDEIFSAPVEILSVFITTPNLLQIKT